MKNATRSTASFAETLRGLRLAAGYQSSRAFFNGVGGSKFFGCTYRQYLNVESGHRCPNPALMGKIAIGLQLPLTRDPESARRLVKAYLQSLLGDGEWLAFVMETLKASDHDQEDSLSRSLVRRYDDHIEPLSRKQSDFILGSLENYWTFAVLSNDSGTWTPEKLAAVTGLPEQAVRAALHGLFGLQILKKEADDSYRCPKPSAVFLHPQDALWPQGDERLRKYVDAMARREGNTLLERRFTARASEAELKAFFPLMCRGLDAAEACTTAKAGPDTALFSLQLLVRKLFPF